jgi:hypothetical protein
LLFAFESPLVGGPLAAESGSLLTGLTVPRPSAAASDTPTDEPDEQLTPRRSGDDPGVRPDEPVLWSGRVRAGHPSSPGGPWSGPRRTGRQHSVTGCMQLSVPPTSVPRLAHRPSVHMHYAPSESASGQYPERLTGPQYPSLAFRRFYFRPEGLHRLGASPQPMSSLSDWAGGDSDTRKIWGQSE